MLKEPSFFHSHKENEVKTEYFLEKNDNEDGPRSTEAEWMKESCG